MQQSSRYSAATSFTKEDESDHATTDELLYCMAIPILLLFLCEVMLSIRNMYLTGHVNILLWHQLDGCSMARSFPILPFIFTSFTCVHIFEIKRLWDEKTIFSSDCSCVSPRVK